MYEYCPAADCLPDLLIFYEVVVAAHDSFQRCTFVCRHRLAITLRLSGAEDDDELPAEVIRAYPPNLARCYKLDIYITGQHI